MKPELEQALRALSAAINTERITHGADKGDEAALSTIAAALGELDALRPTHWKQGFRTAAMARRFYVPTERELDAMCPYTVATPPAPVAPPPEQSISARDLARLEKRVLMAAKAWHEDPDIRGGEGALSEAVESWLKPFSDIDSAPPPVVAVDEPREIKVGSTWKQAMPPGWRVRVTITDADSIEYRWPGGGMESCQVGAFRLWFDHVSDPAPETKCSCFRCVAPTELAGMRVCSTCGNKRCPRTEWHGFMCANSNELNQVGEPETKEEANGD